MTHKPIFFRLTILLGLLLAGLAGEVRAQTVSPDFQRFGNGFDPVFTVVSDHNGYVWAGTTHGLIRYDSHGSVAYVHDPQDSASLCHNTVNALLCLSDGKGILVGTNQGLSLYDPVSDRFEQVKACAELHIRTLLEHNDSLWVGSSSGLMLLTGYRKDFASCRARKVLDGPHITCSREVDGKAYFGTYNRIYAQNGPGQVQEIAIPLLDRWYSNLVCDIIPSLEVPGTLLLGTEYGLVRFNPATRQSAMLLEDIPVRCFRRCSDGSLWIGTDKGIFVFGPEGRRQHFVHESGNATSIPDNVVSRIHEDDRGNIWIATDHGICMTTRSGFYTFVPLRSITRSNEGLAIRALCKDR